MLKAYEPEATLSCLMNYTLSARDEKKVVDQFAKRLGIERDDGAAQEEKEGDEDTYEE